MKCTGFVSSFIYSQRTLSVYIWGVQEILGLLGCLFLRIFSAPPAAKVYIHTYIFYLSNPEQT